jgi:rhodanese-related sulfurtransferase
MRRFILAATLLTTALTAQQAANPVFQSMVKEAKSRVRQVTAKDLQDILTSGAKVVLIDVREDSEWTMGHAKSAIHIGRGVLDRDIESKVPDKNAMIVLYCVSGSRSALASDLLTRMGYTNVASLEGGLKAYQAAGLPME